MRIKIIDETLFGKKKKKNNPPMLRFNVRRFLTKNKKTAH